MHGVWWGTHRASLCAIKLGKVMTKPFGLTPSRFHMLSAIESEQLTWFPQRWLRELLDVTAQTISRMLKSLVASGFIVKRVMEEDRRRREIAFTKSGKERFLRAFDRLVKQGLGAHAAGRALTDLGWPTTLERRTAALAQFEPTLGEFRFGLRDMALFDYSPDNTLPAPIYRSVNHAMEYQDSTPDLLALDDDDDDDAWEARLTAGAT
jgi:DNA-binding MarR family transcriptional regulator